MSFFRLTFDPPYSWAKEPGFARSVQAGDFHGQPGAVSNVKWGPVSGVLNLKSNLNSTQYQGTIIPQSGFTTTTTPGFWRQSFRSTDNAPVMTTTKPSGTDFALIELLISTAIVVIDQTISNYDDLKWVAQTNFSLDPDECWAIHYNAITDEITRTENWMGFQWDNILIHVNSMGVVKVYQYADRTAMTETPTLFDEFEIGDAGRMMLQHGCFLLMPIPGRGLWMEHLTVQQTLTGLATNAHTPVSHGHLIPWPSTGGPPNGSANFSMFQASPWTLALNPYTPQMVAFQRIRFLGPGAFQDMPFDTGYTPANAPAFLSPNLIPTGHGSATATLMQATPPQPNSGNTGIWKPGTNQLASVKLALTPKPGLVSAGGDYDANGLIEYTPFIQGYQVEWAPVMAPRDTTPVLIPYATDYNNDDDPDDGSDDDNNATVIGGDEDNGGHDPGNGGQFDMGMELDFSQDERGEFEGSVKMAIMTDEAKAIVLRGDAMFLLETSEDEEAWSTVAGGMAKHFDYEPILTGVTSYWETTCKLLDMRERLRETHLFNQAAFDSLSVYAAVNGGTNAQGVTSGGVLAGSGFLPATWQDGQSAAQSTILPSATVGRSWLFAFRDADKGEDLVDVMLFVLRAQGIEYMLVHVWDDTQPWPASSASQGWIVCAKPHDTSGDSTWTLTPYSDNSDASQQIWHHGPDAPKLAPEPPEANCVQVVAVTDASQQGQQIPTAMLKNHTSIETSKNPDGTSNSDYLGRTVVARYEMAAANDIGFAMKAARAIFDAVAHNRTRTKKPILIPVIQMALAPNVPIKILDLDGSAMFEGWIKKRHVKILSPTDQTMELDVDTVWQGDIPR